MQKYVLGTIITVRTMFPNRNCGPFLKTYGERNSQEFEC